MLFGVGLDLVRHQLVQLGLRTQPLFELLALLGELVLLAADLHLLQLHQVTQLEFEDRLGLHVGDAEALHQHRLGLVVAADDGDDFVDVQERHQQAFEHMQAVADLLQPVFQTASHGGHAVLEPFDQNLAQSPHARAPVQTDHVQVHAIAAFQVGGGKQVRHQLIQIDPVAARHDHQARGVLVVGFVTQVLDQRQLLGPHLLGDLLEHLGGRHLVRQGVDHHRTVLAAPAGTGTNLAVAGFVQPADVVRLADDVAARRVIRSRHVLQQRIQPRIGRLEQMHAGARQLAQVVRRDVGRHAHGDAGGPVDQDIGQPRRQQPGFGQRAVEIGHEIGRALIEFGQQRGRVRGQLGLGIAHCRERLGVVGGTPVALPVHQRVAVGEGLRHRHHGLVAGRIAVRMELADHVADGPRGFLRLGAGGQAQLAHCVDDATLHRLEAVGDVRQCAIEHDVHRVVQIRLLGEHPQRHALGFVHRGVFGHR